MNMQLTFFIFLTASLCSVIAQDIEKNDLAVFIRFGIASDNDAMGSFGGGAPSYQFWDTGPIYNLGIEKSLSDSFSLQGIVNISSYKYDGTRTYGEKTNDAYNRIFDIMAILKWKLWWFHISGGIGLSHQNGDAIKYLEETEYHSASVRIKAKSKT